MTLKYIYIVLIFIISINTLYSQSKESQFILKIRNEVINEIETKKISYNINDKINEIVKYYKFKDIKEGFNFIDTILNKKIIAENDTLKMHLFSLLAGLYTSTDQTEYASRYLFRAYNISSKLSTNLTNGWTLIGIGNLYYSIGYFEKSHEYFNKALTNFKDILERNNTKEWDNANFGIAVSLENIALSYLSLSKNDSAISYAREALPFRNISGNPMFLQYSKMNLAKVFLESSKIDSSIKYFHESIELSKKDVREIDKSQQFSFMMQSLNGLFRAYTQMKNQDSANYYLNKINKFISKLENVQQFVVNYTSNAFYFYDQKKYQSSIEFAKKALELAKKDSLDYLLNDIYQILYFTFREIKMIDSAFKYLELNYQNIEQNRTKYNIQSVELGESNENIEKSLYEIEKNKKEIDRINNENRINNDRMKNQRYILISVIIFLALIGIGIYNRFHFKNKMVKEIGKKNEDLNKVNEELNKSNETKNTLFSIIAHDLKNSIGSVRDAINLLNSEYNTLSDEEIIEFLDLSKRSSDNLYNLLENLLLWSSAQRQSLKINLIETSLNYIANQSIQLYQTRAKEKNINLVNNLSDNLLLKIDPNQIDTVIRNILNNAVKFTKMNGEIKIYNYQQDDEEFIIIEDNGIGMPKDKADNLFKGTNNKSTFGTDGEKGTGIGLAICKQFISMHNGKIWAESEEGIGTKILFTLPK